MEDHIDDIVELFEMHYRDLILWSDTTIEKLKPQLVNDQHNTIKGMIDYWEHAKGAFKWGLSHATKEKMELLIDEKRSNSNSINI